MTAMRSVGLVARREIIERGRSAYYLGSTLLTILLVVAVIAGPALLESADAYTLGVVGEGQDELVELVEAAPDRDVEAIILDGTDEGEAALTAGSVDAVLARDPRGGYELVWQSDQDPLLAATVSGAVATIEVGERVGHLDIAPGDAAELLAPPSLVHRSLDPLDVEEEGRWWLALVMLLLLFVTITSYGSFVLTGVVEEKSSRVVELLLARLAPRNLLAGKVAGIGVLALGQVGLMVAAALITLRLVPEMPGPIPSVTVGALAWLVVWFVLGYALYSVAYGAVGALASRTEDAQAVSTPLTFILIGVFWFVLVVVADDLDGTVSVLASFVPVTAPLVMPLRLALGTATGWESAAATVVMVTSIYGLVRLAGRIYTSAILRTGRRVSLREAWRSPG